MLLLSNIFWTIFHSKRWLLSYISLLSERNFCSSLSFDWFIMLLWKQKNLKKSVKLQRLKNGNYLEILISQNHQNLDKLKTISRKLWNLWWITFVESIKSHLHFPKVIKNKKEWITVIKLKKLSLIQSILILRIRKNCIM